VKEEHKRELAAICRGLDFINREFEDAEIANSDAEQPECEEMHVILPLEGDEDWDFAITISLCSETSRSVTVGCRTVDSCWFVLDPEMRKVRIRWRIMIPKEVGESLLQGLQLALKHCP